MRKTTVATRENVFWLIGALPPERGGDANLVRWIVLFYSAAAGLSGTITQHKAKSWLVG
jgi:hypothetical protein